MEPAKRLPGASNSAEVGEPRGIHRRRVVDEAGHHQPVGGVEEDDLRVDTSRGRRSRRHLLVGAVDVLTRALAREAHHEAVVTDDDEMVDVRQSGESGRGQSLRCTRRIGTPGVSAVSRSLIGHRVTRLEVWLGPVVRV